MRPDSQFSSLLDRLYSGVGDDGGWKLFLSSLADILPSATASLVLFDPDQKRYSIDLNIGFPVDAVRSYNQHYGAIDEWYRRAKGRVTENWVNDGRSLCPPDELIRTEFFNDFIRHFGWQHECAAVLECRGSVMTVLTMLRRPKDQEFRDSELKLIRALVPHLQRALQLHRRVVDMQARESAQDWALDQLPFGVVILGNTGQVVIANRTAIELCHPRNGLRLTRIGLNATLATDQRHLQALIRTASTLSLLNPAGGFMSVTRPFGSPLHLFVGPLLITASGARSVAVFISDPEQKSPSLATVLSTLFKLTPAEVRLATLLVEGKPLVEIAQQGGVTHGTLRSQLKSVFQKTGTSRQAQLVRLLLLLPASASPVLRKKSVRT
jgi:DNA-binding CsgD family transcriptional regulator